MPPVHVFHRHALARQIANAVMSDAVGSAAPSGLFLAAQRRVGKSTFLREDLGPELEKRGAVVVYVDLWADRSLDPGLTIQNAVRAEIARHSGVVLRLAKAAGMEKVTVGGLSFGLDHVGLGKQVSLSTALAALSDEVKRPIVMLIDEAQQAITTPAGYDALFALKAARDELNSSRHHGLRIVATGSNRDKLAMLRNSKDQAFYGAPLVAFPLLDADYLTWFCHGVHLPAPLDPVAVWPLFVRAGYRPEILGAAADSLRFDFALAPVDVANRFDQAVTAQIEASDQQTLRVIHGLTPLQSTVLRVMAAHGADYAPFEEATLDACAHVLKTIAPKEKVKTDVSNVQQALLALQDKSLVWKERRGVYALEETTMASLMAAHGLLGMVPTKNRSIA